MATRVPVVPAERLYEDPEAVLIDLRSPSEYAEDHPPGAHNVPLFDDDERALIGTLYRRESPDAAFRAAAERTAEGIGELVAGVARLAGWHPPDADLAEEVRRRTSGGYAVVEGRLEVERVESWPSRPVLLTCWRGGLRSRSVVALLRDLGLERAFAVEGGYKGYRRAVRAALERWEPPETYVLRGLTGVGKTLVLRELERQRPGWTLDLEGLAGHRGSVLGMVGLEPVGQKAFESRVARRIARGFPAGLQVVEGESRKVGDAVLPARVWEALTGGIAIELTAPLGRRIDVLLEDYLGAPANRGALRARLGFIEERLGPVKWKGELVRRLDEGREGELVEILLERYYDPLYRHSEKGCAYAATIDSTDPERAARDVGAWIQDRRR